MTLGLGDEGGLVARCPVSGTVGFAGLAGLSRFAGLTALSALSGTGVTGSVAAWACVVLNTHKAIHVAAIFPQVIAFYSQQTATVARHST